MLLRLTLAALACVAVRGEDPGISGLERISTTGGTFSWARFGQSSRFIYAAANGDPYGSCPHVYRFDWTGAQPVSLVSSGLGWERQLAEYAEQATKVEHSLETTAAADWARANKGADLNEALFCSASKCDGTVTNTDVKAACDSNHYIERREGALSVAQFPDHAISSKPLDIHKWQTPRVSRAGLTVWAQKSTTTNTGEEIILRTESGDKTLAATANWADGFVIDDSKPDVRILYSGLKASGAALNALNEGVIPYRGAKIYVWTDLAAATPKEAVLIEDTSSPPQYSYLWPSVSKALPGVVFATRVDHNSGRAVLLKIEEGKAAEVLTDADLNSHHGQVSPDGKFITFIGDRDSTVAQLYIASLGTKPNQKPIFAKKNPASYNMYSEQATNLKLYDDLGTQYSHFSLSADQKTLLYQALSSDSCREVYQLQLDKDESIVRKRLSTGLHDATSPNLYPGTTDILMASTLLRTIPNVRAGVSKFSCFADTCDDPTNDEMKKDCEDNVGPVDTNRPVFPETELVVVNELGLLKRRLTNDNLWQGEVKVSPDGKFIVYGQRNGDTFELRRLNIGEDQDKSEALNLDLKAGDLNFAFDLSFSADSKRLVYAAYRPNDDALKAKFAALLKHNIMDTPTADIHIYDFEAKKESVGLYCRERKYICRSPQFVPDNENRVIMLVSQGDTGNTRPATFEVDGKGQTAVDFTIKSNGAIHLYKQSAETKILISDRSKFLHGDFLVDKPTRGPLPPPDLKTTTESGALRLEVGVLAVWVVLARALL